MNFGLDSFFEELSASQVKSHVPDLRHLTAAKLLNPGQGDFEKWSEAFSALPDLTPSKIDLKTDAVSAGKADDLPDDFDLRTALMRFHPWRKGPFRLFDVLIDTEWRSDLKWRRIEKAMVPLKDKTILDLGCGNGYYLWRMLGCGARLALGVDPSWLYFFQFQVLQKYISDSRAAVLPLGIEDLPERLEGFDAVFSMGLLYHRRDPRQHLQQLSDFLKPGGQVVLETLVVDGGPATVLKPEERYAKMRNVWNIPSCAAAEAWMKQAGFRNIRIADISLTALDEQRKTEWMTFESLEDFLDPSDPQKTIEGYPAPQRAVFLGEK